MDIYEIRRQRLITLKNERCSGKIAALAEKIDTAPSYVSRMLYEPGKKNRKNISDVMVEKIINAFNLPVGWLDGVEYDDGLNNVERLDIQPSYRGEYPVLGQVSAGKFREAVQSFDVEYLPTTVNCSPNSFWLIVDGHSMTAPFASGITFPEGMYILVDPEKEPVNSNFVVSYCAEQQKATFKKLSIEPEGTFLVPLNPDKTYSRTNIEDEFCEIAGVVVDAKWKLV